MKILITGGNGFIAKNLFEQLNDKYSITSVNHQELDLFDSSNVSDYLKRGKFNIIVHTSTYDAAPKHSTKDQTKVLENNLRMFFNLLTKIYYAVYGSDFKRPVSKQLIAICKNDKLY